MSNENNFFESLNRLETLIDSNQTELKRDVELLIDRRFGSLREEVNKLKSSHPSLAQITNLLTLLTEEDNQRNLSDLPDRVRAILSTITSNNHVHRQTPDLDVPEIGDNVTVEPVNIPNELEAEGRMNGLETNAPSTGTTNDGTHVSQIDIPEGGEVFGDNRNESLPEEPNETNSNCDISPLVPASPSDIPVIIKVEGSSSPQSVRLCKRWIAEIDGENLWYCDCGSDECIVKQEIKGEFEIENNGQSVQLDTKVKEEVESGEENVIEPEDGDELNVNQNESLHEQSNGMTQCSVNDNSIDQQVDNGSHEPSEPANDECNQSQTSKHSKIRKRKRTDKSLATESENLLENSLPSSEVSIPITIPRSKRIRVTSPLETETTEQLSTGSEVESIEGDSPAGDGNDPRGEGEKGVEQSEDDESWRDSETELGDEDEDEGGHYKIRTIKLKCIEENCNTMVSNRVELHDHLRGEHHISPYRCLAEGCNERFEQWNGHGLAIHVRENHSNISTWPCPHCTQTFKSQNRLYNHLHMYHFEGQFKCGYDDNCHDDRVATLRSEIRKHQRSVHSNCKTKMFTCQFNNCGKSFNHKGNFDRHQRIHTGVKSFCCDWIGCGKSFTQKCNLNAHQRIHQKVKPFKCTWNMCDYASTKDGNVIKHIRMKHFHLPATQKEQRQRNIEDNRNPYDYLLKEHNNSSI